MTVGDLVIVRWRDAVGPLDLDEGERLQLGPMRTCGWVREVTPQYVTLAPEEYEAQVGRCRAATSIPTGDIYDVVVVEPRDGQPRRRGPRVSDESWAKLTEGGKP